MQRMDAYELLVAEVYDEGVVTEVIRPAAVLREEAARLVLVELSLRDVRTGGRWLTQPNLWRRYDQPFQGPDDPGRAELVGSIEVAYGTPTRYEITLFRATVTKPGTERGMTVSSLCDEALSFGGLSLANCPRAGLSPPPRPFRFGTRRV